MEPSNPGQVDSDLWLWVLTVGATARCPQERVSQISLSRNTLTNEVWERKLYPTRSWRESSGWKGRDKKVWNVLQSRWTSIH